MDIRVGGSASIGPTGPKTPELREPVEAKVLAVRPPRQRSSDPPSKAAERRKGPPQKCDPRGGRVLILMIPEGRQLPAGLARGEYRVFLRFVRR